MTMSGRTGKIGDIHIRYEDPALKDLLLKYKSGRLTPKIKNVRIERYCMDQVSLENLRESNVLLFYTPIYNKAIGEVNAAKLDQSFYTAPIHDTSALFSHDKDSVVTPAVSCFSLILFCRNMKLACAIHVGVSYRIFTEIHRKMFLYGYSNMKKLTGKLPIHAYISGGCMLHREDMQAGYNRNILKSLIPELIGRGIDIKSIDMGGDYYSQELFIQTGEYRATINGEIKL
jgi:hypothetical protein